MVARATATRPPRLLLEAVPVAHPRLKSRRREVLRGEVPTASAITDACRFAPRCPMVAERCRVEAPLPRSLDGARLVACHFAEDTPDLPKGLAA